MKLYAILILKGHANVDAEPLICSSAIDVSSFGFFQRSSAREFMIFMSRTIAKRVAPGSKIQITQDQYNAYALATHDGLCTVASCDKEYNQRVALTMLDQVTRDFQQTYRGKYDNVAGQKDDFIQWEYLHVTLAKYQNPDEADKILMIQKDMNDTMLIMYQAFDQILARNEKLSDLVATSDDLGAASKTFYKQAKKANSSCCTIM